ncbi:MAG: twin-arginine translocase subunit TatC [Rubricoccaceae bacterium]
MLPARAPAGVPPEAASGDGATPPALPPHGGLSPRASLPDPTRPGEGEMPFLDHLEELRWRIIKALAGIVVCAGLALVFDDWIMDVLLLGPTYESFFMYRLLGIDAVTVTLLNRTVTGQFFAYFGTVLAAGLIIGSPVIVYQAWRFIEPGLYAREKRGLRFATLSATFFFVLGISFGYLILTPLALQFFAQFSISDQIANEFDISRYFSMVLTWTFGAGLLFELPVVVYFLARLGVVTAPMLRSGRRIAIVVILVLSAVLTPPDPLSQIIMAIPLMGLYELSIRLAAFVDRRRARELAEEAAADEARTATSPPAAVS